MAKQGRPRAREGCVMLDEQVPGMGTGPGTRAGYKAFLGSDALHFLPIIPAVIKGEPKHVHVEMGCISRGKMLWLFSLCLVRERPFPGPCCQTAPRLWMAPSAIPRALHANLRFVKNIWTVDKQRNLLFIRRASDIYKCKNCK